MKGVTTVVAAAAHLLAVLAPLGALLLGIWNILMDKPVTGLVWLLAAFLLVALRELSEIRSGVKKLVKFEEDAMRKWGGG